MCTPTYTHTHNPMKRASERKTYHTDKNQYLPTCEYPRFPATKDEKRAKKCKEDQLSLLEVLKDPAVPIKLSASQLPAEGFKTEVVSSIPHAASLWAFLHKWCQATLRNTAVKRAPLTLFKSYAKCMPRTTDKVHPANICSLYMVTTVVLGTTSCCSMSSYTTFLACNMTITGRSVPSQ